MTMFCANHATTAAAADAACCAARTFSHNIAPVSYTHLDIVPAQTTAGLPTVGVRCPNHPATLRIIAAAGVPIAAPSGNTSGRPSPTTAQHMLCLLYTSRQQVSGGRREGDLPRSHHG